MAAKNLLGIGCAGIAGVGEHAFDHRGQQRNQIIGCLPFGLGLRLVAEIDLQRPPQCQRPRALVERPGIEQHAPHVRMDHQRVGLGIRLHRAGQAAPLPPVLRIGHGILVGDFPHADALNADTEPGGVHHDEHALQALILLADQISGRPVIIHHAGRIAVDAHLVLDRPAAEVIAGPETPVGIDQKLRHDEQADALHIVRRAADLGQHQMDDVVGHVMLTRRDENLGAADLVAAIRLRLGLGADEAEIGAAMRLGQVHRAGPAPVDHVGQEALFQLVGCRDIDRGNRSTCQARVHRKRHIGGAEIFLHRHRNRVGQSLPAIFGRGTQCPPAAVAELLIRFLEPGRRRHRSIGVTGAAFAVADLVERLQNLLNKLRPLGQDRLNQIGRRIGKARQVRMFFQLHDMLQDELGVLHRCAVAWHLIVLRWWCRAYPFAASRQIVAIHQSFHRCRPFGRRALQPAVRSVRSSPAAAFPVRHRPRINPAFPEYPRC